MSVVQSCRLAGWAALSTIGIERLILPPDARELLICVDHDANGVGERAAHVAGLRWLAEGRKVYFAKPPTPDTDFNDVLIGIKEASNVASPPTVGGSNHGAPVGELIFSWRGYHKEIGKSRVQGWRDVRAGKFPAPIESGRTRSPGFVVRSRNGKRPARAEAIAPYLTLLVSGQLPKIRIHTELRLDRTEADLACVHAAKMTRSTRRPQECDEMPATNPPRAEAMHAQDAGTPARWQDAPKTALSRLPLVIAEWPRNNGEIVRISLDRFKTFFTIDIRIWWRDANGTFKPGRAGLMLPVTHLPKLTESFVSALRRAEALGLVETAESDRSLAERPHRYRQRRR
jgi:hypothetical protein